MFNQISLSSIIFCLGLWNGLISCIAHLDKKGHVNNDRIQDGQVEEERIEAIGGILPL